jgi:hypothetical protein
MIYYFLKIETAILSLLILASLVSCNSNIASEDDSIENLDTLTDKHSSPEILTDSIAESDSIKTDPIKADRYRDEKKLSMPTFQRTQEIGVTDEKFNGEAVLIQLDLSQKTYEANPEFINDHVKGNYNHSKNYFPQDSRGKVASITLNYRIELFEDGYALDPYKVITMRYPSE